MRETKDGRRSVVPGFRMLEELCARLRKVGNSIGGMRAMWQGGERRGRKESDVGGRKATWEVMDGRSDVRGREEQRERTWKRPQVAGATRDARDNRRIDIRGQGRLEE